jgi:hypothetical protein
VEAQACYSLGNTYTLLKVNSVASSSKYFSAASAKQFGHTPKDSDFMIMMIMM